MSELKSLTDESIFQTSLEQKPWCEYASSFPHIAARNFFEGRLKALKPDIHEPELIVVDDYFCDNTGEVVNIISYRSSRVSAYGRITRSNTLD